MDEEEKKYLLSIFKNEVSTEQWRKLQRQSPPVFGISLRNLILIVEKLAKNKNNILFIGEMGTGKEIFARKYQVFCETEKFAPLNCAQISEEFIVSELFGHKKGSFTGATNNRTGLIEEFNRGGKEDGVIFLDEIGDATENFQASILRLLETGDYKPLGENEFKRVKSLRLVAATSKYEKVRQDLASRFICLSLPSLREIREEIPFMIRAMLHSKRSAPIKPKTITELALSKLQSYSWPGNVRELKNTLETAVIIASLYPSVPM